MSVIARINTRFRYLYRFHFYSTVCLFCDQWSTISCVVDRLRCFSWTLVTESWPLSLSCSRCRVSIVAYLPRLSLSRCSTWRLVTRTYSPKSLPLSLRKCCWLHSVRLSTVSMLWLPVSLLSCTVVAPTVIAAVLGGISWYRCSLGV